MKNEKKIIINCKIQKQNSKKIQKQNSKKIQKQNNENIEITNKKIIIKKELDERKNKIFCKYLNNIKNQNKIIQNLYFNINFPNKKKKKKKKKFENKKKK